MSQPPGKTWSELFPSTVAPSQSTNAEITTESSGNSLLGEPRKVFGEEGKIRAMELKVRVQTGQASLAEISEFLVLATADLDKQRQKRNLPFKREDVDFF